METVSCSVHTPSEYEIHHHSILIVYAQAFGSFIVRPGHHLSVFIWSSVKLNSVHVRGRNRTISDLFFFFYLTSLKVVCLDSRPFGSLWQVQLDMYFFLGLTIVMEMWKRARPSQYQVVIAEWKWVESTKDRHRCCLLSTTQGLSSSLVLCVNKHFQTCTFSTITFWTLFSTVYCWFDIHSFLITPSVMPVIRSDDEHYYLWYARHSIGRRESD